MPGPGAGRVSAADGWTWNIDTFACRRECTNSDCATATVLTGSTFTLFLFYEISASLQHLMQPYQALPKTAFLNHLARKSDTTETNKRKEVDITAITEEQYNATLERRQKRAEKQKRYAEVRMRLVEDLE